MKIVDVKLVPIQGAYYYEDIAALQARSIKNSDRWRAPAITPGFRHVREIAEGVSIGLVTERKNTYWGDAVAVSYSGKSGRSGTYRSVEGIRELAEFRSSLLGSDLGTFRGWSSQLQHGVLHNASRYGVSQALLAAVAGESHRTMAQVLSDEWELKTSFGMIAIQGSSGNDRYDNADKMIANRLSALPHGQIDDIAEQLGNDGGKLLTYAQWLTKRILELSGGDYRPTVHLDVHGAIGKIFGQDLTKVADYLGVLEKTLSPYAVRFESVILANSKAEQIESYLALRLKMNQKGIAAKLVADEWANTRADIHEFVQAKAVDMIHIKMPDLGAISESLEAVLECRKNGVETLLGGSCIETEISTRAAVNLAMAVQPTAFLAKPGMGVNEAVSMVRNEMARLLA